jgi:hypothetical protein
LQPLFTRLRRGCELPGQALANASPKSACLQRHMAMALAPTDQTRPKTVRRSGRDVPVADPV